MPHVVKNKRKLDAVVKKQRNVDRLLERLDT
jgi:hypothetical protein